MVFRRFDKPQLVVAGETAEAVAAVKTYYKGDKLVIEMEGISIGGMSIAGRGNVQMNFSGSSMHFYGSVGQVAGRDIINGKPVGTQIDHGRVIVGIALPLAPDIRIKGSGDVTLLDLQQADLWLDIQGSGDIAAYVRTEVRARVAGSGDIVVRGNPPQRDSQVAGSGDIRFR